MRHALHQMSEEQHTSEAPEAPAEPEAPAQAQTPPAPESPPADAQQPKVGPRILGVAPEAKPLPVVKAKLDLRPPKPPREPLPWPELREAVASIKDDLDINDLKELFRLIPADVRDEVVEGVRGLPQGRPPAGVRVRCQVAGALGAHRSPHAAATPSPAPP